MSKLSDQEIEQGIRDAVELLDQLHQHCNADFWYRLGSGQDKALDGARIIGMARSYQISYLTWRPIRGPWGPVPKSGETSTHLDKCGGGIVGLSSTYREVSDSELTEYYRRESDGGLTNLHGRVDIGQGAA